MADGVWKGVYPARANFVSQFSIQALLIFWAVFFFCGELIFVIYSFLGSYKFFGGVFIFMFVFIFGVVSNFGVVSIFWDLNHFP